MKKVNKVTKFIQQFFFDKDTNKIDINNYGVYHLGLTSTEVTDYLHMRALQKTNRLLFLSLWEIKSLQNKYNEIAGSNTCAVVNNVVLHYRWDVERYADVLFNNIKTYFD